MNSRKKYKKTFNWIKKASSIWMALMTTLGFFAILIGFYALIFGSDYADYLEAALYLFLIIVLWILIGVAPFYLIDRELKERNKKQNFTDALSAESAFVLLLRSFVSEIQEEEVYKETEYYSEDPEIFPQSPKTEIIRNVNFIKKIESHVQNIPILLVGADNEYYDDIIVLDATIEKWLDLVGILMKECKLIIVLPGTTSGIEKELSLIKDYYKNKTVFVMPPSSLSNYSRQVHDGGGLYRSQISVNYKAKNFIPSAWSQITTWLERNLNLKLVDYDEKGGYIYLPPGQEGVMYPFSKNGFEAIFNKNQLLPPEALSLGETLKNIPNDLYLNKEEDSFDSIIVFFLVLVYLLFMIFHLVSYLLEAFHLV